MAQISRVCTSEAAILTRICYNYHVHLRRGCKYYEALRISPNATHKEIKNAYIKLSKEMHPDCGKKGNHANFIKINEAYNVLSKRKSKYSDEKSKYANTHRTKTYHYNGFDDTFKQWKEYNSHYTTNHKIYFAKKRQQVLGYCLLFIVFGLFLQLLHIHQFIKIDRRAASDRSKKLLLEYQTYQKENNKKTLREKLDKLIEQSKKI